MCKLLMENNFRLCFKVYPDYLCHYDFVFVWNFTYSSKLLGFSQIKTLLYWSTDAKTWPIGLPFNLAGVQPGISRETFLSANVRSGRGCYMYELCGLHHG